MPAGVIMQKTVLRGETTSIGNMVVASMCVKTKKEGAKKYAMTFLRLAHWCAVMQSGLSLCRIGTFSDGSDCQIKKNQPRGAYVVLDLPPKHDVEALAQHHNRCSCARFPAQHYSRRFKRRQESILRLRRPVWTGWSTRAIDKRAKNEGDFTLGLRGVPLIFSQWGAKKKIKDDPIGTQGLSTIIPGLTGA